MTLTARQQQVVDFLRDYAAREGMPPTQAEIAGRFGFTQKAAGDHLRLIAAKGVIEIRRDIPRGIRFSGRSTQKPGRSLMLPLVLRLDRGVPTLHADEVDEWLPIAPQLFRPRADYLRRASGVSMIELGIRQGDLVGVQLAPFPAHGEVVVARRFAPAGIELVVRRCRRRGQDQQPSLQDVAAGEAAAAVEIEGLYCGHFHPHAR